MGCGYMYRYARPRPAVIVTCRVCRVFFEYELVEWVVVYIYE